MNRPSNNVSFSYAVIAFIGLFLVVVLAAQVFAGKTSLLHLTGSDDFLNREYNYVHIISETEKSSQTSRKTGKLVSIDDGLLVFSNVKSDGTIGYHAFPVDPLQSMHTIDN